MVIRFKLQPSERFKWREFNISDPNPNNPVVILRFATLTRQPKFQISMHTGGDFNRNYLAILATLQIG
jgi:hypothetical protein